MYACFLEVVMKAAVVVLLLSTRFLASASMRTRLIGRISFSTFPNCPTAAGLGMASDPSKTFANTGTATIPMELKQGIDEYLMLRVDDLKYVPRNVTISERRGRKAEDALIMFKPAGWYKDTSSDGLRARSNTRAPTIAHPLSYTELQKFGYERYSNDIMRHGGPHVVGKAVGLEWEDVREIWDEKFRPTRAESYSFNTQGSLLLGNALDSALSSAAERIDLVDVKRTLAEKEEAAAVAAAVQAAAGQEATGTRDYEQEWKDFNAARYKDWGNDEDDDQSRARGGTRFSLAGAERVNLVAMALSGSIGWGRAFHEMAQLVSSQQGQGGQLLHESDSIGKELLSSVSLGSRAGGLWDHTSGVQIAELVNMMKSVSVTLAALSVISAAASAAIMVVANQQLQPPSAAPAGTEAAVPNVDTRVPSDVSFDNKVTDNASFKSVGSYSPVGTTDIRSGSPGPVISPLVWFLKGLFGGVATLRLAMSTRTAVTTSDTM